jgi:hypothetical protein
LTISSSSVITKPKIDVLLFLLFSIFIFFDF